MKKQTISIITSMLLLSQLGASEKLESIVITAKSPSAAIDMAGSYTIISQEEIKQMNANTIAEVLAERAGISTGVNSGSQYGRSSINLRGMDSKHSLILIDGKRVSASDALIGMSDFAYSWVPLNAIEKIEVVKGPMSSLYGSSAIGGVVNIITKKPKENFFGEVDAKYGFSSADGADEQDYSFNLGGKITDKLSATFFAQTIKIEPMKDGSNVLAKREGRDVKNGIINLWYDIDDSQQIAISSMRGNEIRDNLKYEEYYDIDKSHDSIEYRKYFDDIKMNLKYYMTSLDAHSDDASLLYTHKMDDEVINAEFAISKFENNYIIIGAERRVEKYHKAYDLTPAKDFKDEIDYMSFYFQDEIAFGEKTLLTLGARYDKHEKFGGELSPKAYLVYKLDDYNRLKGGYGHGFNAPSLTQNSDDYVLAYPINTSSMPMLFYRFQGNSELKPEISDSFEIGYEYAKDTTSFKTTAFYTKVSDLITYKDNGTTVVMPIAYQEKLYSNVDEATIYGLEVEYEKKQFLSNLDIYMGYSYLHTEDEATGKELLLRPSHKANLKLSTMLPLNIKSTLRVNYIGEQYNGEKDIGSYATAGLQFSKEMMKNLTLFAGVDNLTDKQLDDDYDFQLKNRVIYIRINYKF
ncbi:MAG: hypothetical protein C0627_04895 [Sulfurimonas sp.]|nr:MAG: hypothetical protein C0627_04895 [Sulfurimonas sp.]